MHVRQKQKVARRLLIVALVAGMLTGPARGDDSVPATAGAPLIEEIVVVANKFARPVRDIAATVSVFDKRESRFELATEIADVFRYAPAVNFEVAGNRFGAESINIRGISGNRVSILLDGVPVNDNFAVGSFSNAVRDLVASGLVQRIEVLHGPASALYGSSAIGGVVALSTPDLNDVSGGDDFGGSLVSTFDSASDEFALTALNGMTAGSVALVAGVAVGRSSETDAAASDINLDQRAVDNQSGLLKLVYDDPSGNSWHATALRQQTDVQSSLESMLGSGRFRNTTRLDGDDRFRADSVSLEYEFGAGVVRAFYHDADVEQLTYDERALAGRPVAIDRFFSFAQDSRGIEVNLQREFVTGPVTHRLGAGVEGSVSRVREYRDALETGLDDGLESNVLLGEVFPLRDFPLSRSEELAAYIEDTMDVGRWTLIAGLRADRFDMRPIVDALYAEDYPFAEPVAISDAELSPKLGVIFRIGDAAEAYLQYAHGFRAPPYADANTSLDIPLFNIRAIPNPDLRSEHSDAIDFGFRWRGQETTAGVSVFRTNYEDFIEPRVMVGIDPDSGRLLFQSQNVERARIEGVEASASIDLDRFLPGISLDVAAFVASGENERTGAPLNSVGPRQAVLGVNWQPGSRPWRASLRSTLTDGWSSRDEAGGPLFKPAGHAIFDLIVAHRTARHLTLRLAISNITDRVAWRWSSVRGLPPGDPTLPFLSMPGRSYSLGFDVYW